MKTKTLKKNKVNVVTMGCSKNLYDSEVMMAQLKANKFEVEHESKVNDASIVIINTCGFIESAKEESINTILDFVEAKKEGLVEKVYVSGCLSERYKDQLEDEIPDVDAYFGSKELPNILRTLNANYKHELVGERLLTTPHHYAYLKIAEGCDRPCSFCAIPLMRGKHRSTSIEDLISNAKSLAKKGVKEIMLIAQDLTYYGLDLYKKRALAACDSMTWDNGVTYRVEYKGINLFSKTFFLAFSIEEPLWVSRAYSPRWNNFRGQYIQSETSNFSRIKVHLQMVKCFQVIFFELLLPLLF